MEGESIKFTFEMVGSGIAGAAVGAVAQWLANRRSNAGLETRVNDLSANLARVEGKLDTFIKLLNQK